MAGGIDSESDLTILHFSILIMFYLFKNVLVFLWFHYGGAY